MSLCTLHDKNTQPQINFTKGSERTKNSTNDLNKIYISLSTHLWLIINH
jgi:hypothetical protein